MLLARISKERSLPIRLYQRDFVVMFHLHNSLAFCIMGLLVLTKDLVIALQTLAFFGSCAAIFIYQLRNQTPSLRLDYGGFTIKHGAKQQGVPVAWSAIDEFIVVKSGGHQVVGWCYKTKDDHRHGFKRCSPDGKFDAALPYRYSVNPKKLAALMNELCRCYQMTKDYVADFKHQ